MENSNFFQRNKSILSFLIVEMMALLAFNFGNITSILGIAVFLLAAVGILFILKLGLPKESFIKLLVPIILLLFVSLIGAFNGFSKGFSKTSNLSLLVSLPSVFILGFVARNLNDIKPKNIILIIGAAIGAITLFGLFSTLIEYGFFYSAIYKKTPNYYYNGIPFDVTKEMYWLNGFSFGEVYIEYGSLFAILSASFLPALLFVSPKEHRNEFMAIAAIGAVGLITLLIIPNLKALIILLAISFFGFAFKFLKNKKNILKIMGICFVCVVGFGLLFYILALTNAAMGFKFGGALERLFVSNRIMSEPTKVFKSLFIKSNGKYANIFGIEPIELNNNAIWAETNIFEIQILKEVGLFGSLAFIGLIVFMGFKVVDYLKSNEDDDQTKVITVSLLLCFFVFESLFNVINIEPHGESYNPFLRNGTLLVMLFLFGFIILGNKKEEATNE